MKPNLLKPLVVLLTCTFSLLTSYGQSPEKMSYQAVIRNSVGELVINQQVGMRISILQGSITGAPVFTQTLTPTTNANGLVSLEIGEGSFDSINWYSDTYFIKTETDPAGGTNYTITGTSQLLSVPYALHAKQAESLLLNNGEDQSQNNEIFFSENGQIRSFDNFHRIIFRREEDILEFREYGDIIFSTGSTEGETNAMNIQETGNVGIGIVNPISKLDVNGNINLNSHNITNLATPINDNDAASKAYVDNASAAHSHSATDIASGTLNIARIPTGTTSSTVSFGNHTHGNITNAGTIGTTAGRIVTTGSGGTLHAMEGTAAGQILYWNGTAWVTIAAGSEGQILTLSGGVPKWSYAAITIAGSTDAYNPTTNKVWMDRNLGASQVATSSTDADSYGDLYQWGRAADGHESRTSSTTTTLATSNTPGHGNFITTSSSPYDWRSPQNDNLWQGVSGTNNPCPSGYRLPTEAEWEAERTSWSSNNAAGTFASPLKLSVAGRRDGSSGSLGNVGSYGFYWSSTVGGTYSRYLYFFSSAAVMGSGLRAYGISVRCLKD